MAQVFHPSFNTLSRVTLFGALGFIAAALWIGAEIHRSPWSTDAFVAHEQPVPFSHRHHVGQLGLDCRYCHTAVEESAHAGIPPTKTCMTCHSQLYTDSPMLEPIRESYRTDEPVAWNRVHDLPDFAYFNHSIHVKKGIGCVSCHGQVDEMALIWQERSLQMEWCLDCHREPERFIRPVDRIFDMGWDPSQADAPTTQEELGRELVRRYDVDVKNLTNCSICHR